MNDLLQIMFEKVSSSQNQYSFSGENLFTQTSTSGSNFSSMLENEFKATEKSNYDFYNYQANSKAADNSLIYEREVVEAPAEEPVKVEKREPEKKKETKSKNSESEQKEEVEASVEEKTEQVDNKAEEKTEEKTAEESSVTEEGGENEKAVSVSEESGKNTSKNSNANATTVLDGSVIKKAKVAEPQKDSQENSKQESSAKDSGQKTTEQSASNLKAKASQKGSEDLAERLGNETGAKVSNVKYESSSKVKEQETEHDRSGNSLLQKLSTRTVAAKHTTVANKNSQDVELESGSETKSVLNVDTAKVKSETNLLKNSVSSALGKADSVGQLRKNNSTEGSSVEVSGETAALKSGGRLMSQQTAQTGMANYLRNVNTIQDIMNRIQTALKDGGLESGPKMSLDFESKSLGQMHLSLQQKGDSISVNLQVGTESSRQELLNQQNDLANQMKQLGYKDVALNITTSDGSFDEQQQKHNQAHGNENEENVKLAGNDHFDLSQILAM
jgi:hypothetical protein